MPRTALRRSFIILIILAASMLMGFKSMQSTPVLEIWEIQGDGWDSPYDERVVTTEDNIITAVSTRGFFMQTPPDRSDGDPMSSDGIFVNTKGRPEGIYQGDRVTVTGEVIENYENTEFDETGIEIEILSSYNQIPDPVVISAPFPGTDLRSPDDFERYEGMLVTVEGAVAVGGEKVYYEGQPKEETEVSVVLGNDRPFREPGMVYYEMGDLKDLTEFDNNPEIFEFGFGGGADTDDFDVPDIFISTGMTLSGSGPVIYRYHRFQVWPLAGTLTIDESGALSLPRHVPAGGEGDLRIGTQNVENLFDRVNDRGVDDGFDTPTSDEVYSIQLEKLARQICENLGAPEIVALQEVENINALEGTDGGLDLTGKIEEVCGVAYDAHLIEGLDGRGIDNAYLTKDTVTVDDLFQIGHEAVFTPTQGSGSEPLFDRPPLVLEATYSSKSVDFPVTVINVHNKSYYDSERDRYRELRYQEAVFLAEYVQSRQLAEPGINIMVTGDFNAFQFTDGIAPSIQIIAGTLDPDSPDAIWWPGTDLVEPDLVIQTLEKLDPAERYSYLYDGSAQELDHILTSAALDAYVTDVSYSRGNPDAAYIHVDDPSTPLSCSDHDGAVITIDPAGYTTPQPPEPTTEASAEESEMTDEPAPVEEIGGGLSQTAISIIVFVLAAITAALVYFEMQRRGRDSDS